jgi:hypothetical protein
VEQNICSGIEWNHVTRKTATTFKSLLIVLEVTTMTIYDMLKLNLLEEIYSAGRRACLPESICAMLEWTCENPGSKTAGRILHHLTHIMANVLAMPGTSDIVDPDQRKRRLSHSIDVLIYELYYDVYSDVDAADSVAIMALLV